MNTTRHTPHATPRSLPAIGLALVMTLAMLGGIDHLAAADGAASTAAVQLAKAAAPRA